MLNNSCEGSRELFDQNNEDEEMKKLRSQDLKGNPTLLGSAQLKPTPLLGNNASNNLSIQLEPPNAPDHCLNPFVNKSRTEPVQRKRGTEENDPSGAASFFLPSPVIKFKSRKEKLLPVKDYFSHMSDELVLYVFQWLNKRALAKCARVSRRFGRLSLDDSLWRRIDMGHKKLAESVMHKLLDRGAVILRLARADIESDLCPLSPQTRLLLYPKNSMSKLTHLDLSMAVYKGPDVVAGLLERCQNLQALSLEHGQLNSRGCLGIAQNAGLEILNLALCQGLDFDGLEALLEGCRRLKEVNFGWSHLTHVMQTLVCGRLPSTVTKLNISGYRADDALDDSDMKLLVNSCPGLTELDISDCTQVTPVGLDTLINNLTDFTVLSASRCYGIEPVNFSYCKDLKELNVFGSVTDEGVKVLSERMKGTKVNCSLFSTIARPTVGIRRTSIWEHRVRDE